MQSELHPSPSFRFPSSHCSVPLILPSLHTVTHVSTVVGEPPVQMYPGRVPVQSLEHPIPSSLFPSSQVSPKTLKLSPQIGTQVLPTQLQPGSYWQMALQPSKSRLLPSSQFSPGASTMLFPQLSEQTEGEVGLPAVQE